MFFLEPTFFGGFDLFQAPESFFEVAVGPPALWVDSEWGVSSPAGDAVPRQFNIRVLSLLCRRCQRGFCSFSSLPGGRSPASAGAVAEERSRVFLSPPCEKRRHVLPAQKPLALGQDRASKIFFLSTAPSRSGDTAQALSHARFSAWCRSVSLGHTRRLPSPPMLLSQSSAGCRTSSPGGCLRPVPQRLLRPRGRRAGQTMRPGRCGRRLSDFSREAIRVGTSGWPPGRRHPGESGIQGRADFSDRE